MDEPNFEGKYHYAACRCGNTLFYARRAEDKLVLGCSDCFEVYEVKP